MYPILTKNCSKNLLYEPLKNKLSIPDVFKTLLLKVFNIKNIKIINDIIRLN